MFLSVGLSFSSNLEKFRHYSNIFLQGLYIRSLEFILKLIGILFTVKNLFFF